MASAEEVLDYLKSNPSFFEDHRELLADLEFVNGDEAAPFYQRQLQVLRERASRHKAKIDLIVASAKRNQKLEADFLETAVRLLARGADAADPRQFVMTLMKDQFGVKDVFITMQSDDVDARHPGYDDVRRRVAHKSSVCDDRVSSGLLGCLFGPDNKNIGSCAFIPLVYDDALTGIMVLASNSLERFQPGAGIMFLDRLGHLIGGYFHGRQ